MAREFDVDVLVEELQFLLLVLTEPVVEIVDDVVARNVLNAVEKSELRHVRTASAEHTVFARPGERREVRKPPVGGCEAVFARELMVEGIGVGFEFERAERRTRSDFGRQVDDTGARVSARCVARTRRDLQRAHAVEAQRIRELGGEGVGVADSLELEAFFVLTAATQHGVAARIERRTRQSGDEVRFADVVVLTEVVLHLRRVDGVRVGRLRRLIGARDGTRGHTADRGKRLAQRLRERKRLVGEDVDALDRDGLEARTLERHRVAVRRKPGDREKAFIVRLCNLAPGRREGRDGDICGRRIGPGDGHGSGNITGRSGESRHGPKAGDQDKSQQNCNAS